MDARIAKRLEQEAARQIDYRYVKFNLETEAGQRGYAAYLQNQNCTPEYFGSDLEDHRRQQVFDEKHYWQAEAVYRKVFGLAWPKPSDWKRGDRVDRPLQVELFI